jgi:hypothetical protein
MVFVYGRSGCLTAKRGGFRAAQFVEEAGPLDRAVQFLDGSLGEEEALAAIKIQAMQRGKLRRAELRVEREVEAAAVAEAAAAAAVPAAVQAVEAAAAASVAVNGEEEEEQGEQGELEGGDDDVAEGNVAEKLPADPAEEAAAGGADGDGISPRLHAAEEQRLADAVGDGDAAAIGALLEGGAFRPCLCHHLIPPHFSPEGGACRTRRRKPADVCVLWRLRPFLGLAGGEPACRARLCVIHAVPVALRRLCAEKLGVYQRDDALRNPKPSVTDCCTLTALRVSALVAFVGVVAGVGARCQR